MARSRRQRESRRDDPSSEEEQDATRNIIDSDGDADESTLNSNEQRDQLARKLVRYALSCEYARRPIKRQDITHKVLGAHSRQFKAVYAEAQMMLQHTFGMQLVELPPRDKTTYAQKRAALKSDKAASASTGNYIVVSTLGDEYKVPEIIPPPRVPTAKEESSYVGLYSFIIATIYLSGGSLPETKLDQYLRRVNAEQNTPIEKTDKLLQRMITDQYLLKSRENMGGEDVFSYTVGARGKMEIGEEGVAEFVQRVYGMGADEELSKRIERSLALVPKQRVATKAPASTQRVQKRKTRQHEDDIAEDEEMEDAD